MKTSIQLGTWMGYAKEKGIPFDMKKCLEEVRASGYEGIETGGGQDTLGKPADFLKLTRAAGLEICSYASGVTYNPWPAQHQIPTRLTCATPPSSA